MYGQGLPGPGISDFDELPDLIVLLFLVVNRGKPRGWFAYGWLVNHGLPLAI